ncbi:MAG: SGNH/GDSL hydrolase family protein [bacterium]|nr:SGNH/GDSL hydrolase family protein [bacterium]
MKLLKRIFIILIILITILIYYKFENKKINYVAINITEKENYSDYFVKNIKNLGKFNKILETKMSSEEILEDIDNNIEIDENITIQNIINSASIITIMLNPNEIYNVKTYNELEIIISNINQTLSKIRKISNAKIYFLGFYNIYDNKEIDNKIIYTNSKIENLCNKYKIDYIDLYNIFKNKKYLFYINDNNLPNKDANIMISNEILKKFNQKSI